MKMEDQGIEKRSGIRMVGVRYSKMGCVYTNSPLY